MFVYHPQNFYNKSMYIKIKNPTHYALLAQLGTLIFLLVVILVVITVFTIASGSITAVWEGAVEFFNYTKQEKGLFTAVFCVFGILMIPIGIIAGIIEWRKKRTRWVTPTAVYALDFGPEGVTAYTRQNTQFLPYKETDFKMTGELVTVRTKNGSHAALHALTLTFLSQGHHTEVSHKPMTYNLLYQLADLHAYFKTFAFNCKCSSSYDTDQQELATFLKEQIQNQMCYGLHCRYRSHFVMVLCSLLFMTLGVGALLLAFAFGFIAPFRSFMGWVLLIQGAGLLVGGIILLYHVIRDKRTAYKLKQLRGK